MLILAHFDIGQDSLAFDADGDGDLDLAEGNGGGGAERNALFLNNGAGVFIQSAAGEFGLGGDNTFSLLAIDVDGDGDIDLLQGEGVPSPSKVLLNDGTGSFVREDGGEFDDSALNTVISIAALGADGDGDLDVARGTGTGAEFFFVC